jgi:hypothetical protein
MKRFMICTMLVTLVACNEKDQEVAAAPAAAKKVEAIEGKVMSPKVKRGDILCKSNEGDLLISFTPYEQNKIKTFLVNYGPESIEVPAQKYFLSTGDELTTWSEQGYVVSPSEITATDTFAKVDLEGEFLLAFSNESSTISNDAGLAATQRIQLALDLVAMEGSIERAISMVDGVESVVELNKLAECKKVE